MTTPHKHRDILIAIADGKKIQYQYLSPEWKDCTPELALSQLAPDYHSKPSYTLRIAPETVLVNGVTCPKPVVKPNAVACVISIVLGGTNINQYAFATEADARTVFDALCKPFKEGV